MKLVSMTELEAACAAVDSGTGGTEAVGTPLPIALGI